jgi:hypothetical protein
MGRFYGVLFAEAVPLAWLLSELAWSATDLK